MFRGKLVLQSDGERFARLMNPLGTWKVRDLPIITTFDASAHQKIAPRFPTIARMARDYLAIPGTSVSVD